MKKIALLILLCCMVLPAFAACGEEIDISSSASTEESVMIPDENAKIIWDECFSDVKNGFDNGESVYKAVAYTDGNITETYSEIPKGDTRYLFENGEKTRVAVLSEGYALTLPSVNVNADFSLGALRSKYVTDDYALTVSFEDQNPYGNNENGWKIYFDEWLVRYFENTDFMLKNNIRRTRKAGVTEELLDGYVVNYYDMTVGVALKMEYPYYSIAIVRPKDNYDYFWFFVLKSKSDMYDAMDAIVGSFSEFDKTGTPINSVGAYELKVPEFWSEETRAYYEKLQNQTTVDFGAFYEKNDPEYIEWLASEEGIDNDMDIFMTYLHIGWGDGEYTKNSLDLDFVNSQAGGNGFNGKPVLELTYQFTTTNNVLGGYTPMYDICRGRLDNQFRELAQAIKSYGKPILFRLNNEMNTDWTSYCGMQTMNDPDIFITTWRRMYDIFVEEGVDNCIWIWNPIATSCPYSNWGDSLNYFPGSDYVQMLGLTYYQMNNTDYMASFKEMYQELYAKNTPYFDNYPAIIGEFGCAAGGEVVYDWGINDWKTVENIEKRRQDQAKWITEMFDCLINNQQAGYEFCKNIKAASWFSCNDYVTVNGEQRISNYLKLDSGVPLAIEAFRDGYARLKDKR